MNHQFTSGADTKICSICKRPASHHSAYYACEACGKLSPVYKDGVLNLETNGLEIISDKILACNECKEKEDAAVALRVMQPVTYTAVSPTAIEMMDNARQNSLERINIKYARELDTSITRITELFNAKTVPIIELKAVIDADDSIAVGQAKHEALFKILAERINKLKPLMRDARTVLTNLGNEEQSIQSYMNNMANRVRKEVREQYGVKDSNYQVKAPPKSIKTPKAAINKEELKFEAKRVSKELGFPEAQAMALIEMMCKQRKISPSKAANQLCKNTKEIDSENES